MLLRRSGAAIEIETPSKVNLFLEVLGRRSDGYHDLETIMMATSLSDRLRFAPRVDSQICLHLSQPNRSSNVWCGMNQPREPVSENNISQVPLDPSPIPTDSNNLVWRALDQVQQAFGIRRGMDVWLNKFIPTQAGMGGGSSDAAAAIVAAMAAWTGRYEPQLAGEIAAKLGSDVNFFLEGNFGRSWGALCKSRGESVQPFSIRSPIHLVIAQPPQGCSTAAVFRQLVIPEIFFSFEPVLAALTSGNLSQLGSVVFNRLELAAQTQSVWIGKYREAFDQLGATAHLLTGSGSARVGICHSASQAIAFARQISTLVSGHVYVARNWNAPSIEVQLRSLGYLCSTREMPVGVGRSGCGNH
jgi:4-diphosphocytidyl-2-C-methyl-D-erythritol kinase